MPKIQVNVRLPMEMVEQIRKYAEQKGISQADALEEAWGWLMQIEGVEEQKPEGMETVKYDESQPSSAA